MLARGRARAGVLVALLIVLMLLQQLAVTRGQVTIVSSPTGTSSCGLTGDSYCLTQSDPMWWKDCGCCPGTRKHFVSLDNDMDVVTWYCSPCAAGTYSNVNQWQTREWCDECPAGTFSQADHRGCSTCDAGKYSTGGAAACSSCPPLKTSLAGATSLAACVDAQTLCLADACTFQYNTNLDWQEGPCHCCAGQEQETQTYRIGSTRSRCFACNTGFYMDQIKHTTKCKMCPDGKQSSEGITYLVGWSPYIGANACIDCVPGKYNQRSVDGINVCESCLPGSYTTTSGQTVCQQCTAGKYSIYQAEGSTGCVDCDAGKYIDSSGAITCIDCLPGKYQHVSACLVRQECSLNDANVVYASTGQVESSVCECDSGWMSEYKEVMKVSGACLPELDGLYEAWPEQPFENQFWNTTTNQGNQYMLRFYASKYNSETFIITKWPSIDDSPLDVPVSDLCKTANDCKRQRAYAYTMDTLFWPARSGWFELKPSQVSTTWHCAKWNNGAYQWEQSSTMRVESFFTMPECKCPEGTYRVSGGKSCLPCPKNSTSVRNSDPGACVCNTGYSPMLAQGSGTPPMPLQCSACTTGKFKSTRSKAPSNPSDSYIKNENCIDCPPGKYSAETGLSVCIDCVAGKYATSDRTRCEDCPSNSTSPAGSAAEECVCDAGYEPVLPTGSATVSMPLKCSACATGKFKSIRSRAPAFAHVNYIDFEKCQACAEGLYAAHRDDADDPYEALRSE